MDDYEKQANDFLDETYTSIFFERMTEPRADGFTCGGYDYKVTLYRNGRTWKFDFSDSKSNKDKNINPTAYDVLACLQKYDIGTFKDFCDDFDYSDDSIKALKLYKAVKKEYEEVYLMFSDVMDKLEEIQ